ncbi:MAG: hypothetical protein M3Z08_06735 [Chloroflexota bacterium]|nr:hypothetical protein [Chloroflexota bacterium]
MSHRYGRHGPRAWLRWRERHHRISLMPAVVQAETKIIHVRVPVNAERIILIIMGNSFQEMPQEQIIDAQLAPRLSSVPPSLPPGGMQISSAGEDEIKLSAEIEAETDLGSLLPRFDTEPKIGIDDSRLLARARDLAVREVKDYRSKHTGIATSEEFTRLIKVYQDEYLSTIEKVLDRNKSKIWRLSDTKEKALRTAAIDDKKIERPSGSDGRISHYMRDCGVLHVLSLYYSFDIEYLLQDVAKMQKMHQLIDAYEEYQRQPESEEIWPNQATFQRQ